MVAPQQPTSSAPAAHAGIVRQLPVDIYQSASAVTVFALLPGANAADISVSIEGLANIVIIEGVQQRPDSSELAAAGGFVTAECAWGRFYRRIILPTSVVVEQASARIKNGILVIHLPSAGASRAVGSAAMQ